MTFPSSSKTKDYDDALNNTEEISSPAAGFVIVKDATNKDINRQNNTIIDLLVKINLKLDQLLQKPISNNTEQVTSLVKQLEGLTLGKTRATKKEPFYEDQIRSYRRMARPRYEAQRRLSNSRGTRTLEGQLNPEAELELSQRQRASLVPAETLYSTNWNAGVNALVVLRDTRWRDDRSIIGTMEVDLSGGTQLIYIAPNMLISIEDFYHHIELAIQTHGYEEWNSAESNLLITRGLIGRLTNTSYAGFRYNVQNVADYLASTGIHAVAASPRTITELQGMRWILQPPANSQIRNPQEVRTSTLMDGSIALAFQGYKAAQKSEARRMSNFDTERIDNEGEEEFAGVFIDNGNRWEELGQPDTNPRLGTLGESSGSIWEDTLWEDDPYFDLEDLPVPPEEEDLEEDDEEREAYFLGLENLENDYPITSPTSVLQEEHPNTQWDDNDEEADTYWQNIVEQVEQVEGQWAEEQNTVNGIQDLSIQEDTTSQEGNEPNDWLPYAGHNNEAAHMGSDSILEQLESMEYPILRSMVEQATNENVLASSSAISRYNPPQEPLMGQVNYPPAQISSRIDQVEAPVINGKFKPRGFNHQPWTLPSAQTNDGAILVLPEDIDQYSEVQFIENLLGENEKKMWIQWRMAYATEYEALIQMAGETQNILSAIRRSFLLEDPYQGSTVEQDQAYIDIGRLTCHSNEVEAAFKAKYPANQVGVIPRIHFTYQYLAEICKKAAIQKSVKDLAFCNKIPIPGYYNKQKKFGLRKAKTYKGKPYDSHVRDFKKKKVDQQKKCKCFICGEPGHFARDCKKQTGNIARASILDQLDLPSDYDVISVDLNEADSDAICSFSEGEAGPSYINLVLDDTPWIQDTIYMLGAENCGWRSQVFVGEKMKNCQHQWEENQIITDSKYLCCTLCKLVTTDTMRIHCLICKMIVCPACGPFYLNKTLKLKKTEVIPPYHKEEKVIQELLDYTTYLRNIVDRTPVIRQENIQFLKVRRLTSTAKLPVRRTIGAAGYDIFLDEEIHVLPHQQCLAKTDISLEFSEGYYARIAPRSGAAFRLNYEINAGVIDSDFRGEVCIFIHNFSTFTLSLAHGSSIAQLIFEKIMTPLVLEVNELEEIERGIGSFGSTDKHDPESSHDPEPS
ncbi:hypothetical protein ZIOFF_068489 [Zingiber officinale]|uniref:dUTP diphosphatase n=1 Tax=Zingiber officinale TaxID=94328 RepID=A0A8J5CEU2_ZINOF|nr:hypothetical protein ZIOFF_068489 [Zingiber officinale]